MEVGWSLAMWWLGCFEAQVGGKAGDVDGLGKLSSSSCTEVGRELMDIDEMKRVSSRDWD